jgi:hypothetical protein
MPIVICFFLEDHLPKPPHGSRVGDVRHEELLIFKTSGPEEHSGLCFYTYVKLKFEFKIYPKCMITNKIEAFT